MNIEKEKTAIERLKMFCPEDGYYLAYSGGKDSDVLLALAKLAGVKFDAHHNLTTADAPETIYHVRKHKEVQIDRPEETMWELIPRMMFPPTMICRYCCKTLKESSGECRCVATGVRWAESTKRKKNSGLVQIRGLKTGQTNQKGAAVFNDDNEETRQMVENCYRHHRISVNPIIDWTDEDVWSWLLHYNIELNPLYEEGFKRVGCVMCPMARYRIKTMEMRRYPKFVQMYIHAFERMISRRKERGKDPIWHDGEECFKWWIGEDPDQYTLEQAAEIAEMKEWEEI